VSCGAGSLQYNYRQWDKDSGGKAMLASIHEILQNGRGVPASIRYQKVQDKIRAFRPYGEFQISGAEQARVCPN